MQPYGNYQGPKKLKPFEKFHPSFEFDQKKF